jgi:hypothetical protein
MNERVPGQAVLLYYVPSDVWLQALAAGDSL